MEITTEKILREEIKEITAELDEAKSELEHALEKWRIAQGTAMERKKKIEQLEKKLEEADVDFIRVRHARAVGAAGSARSARHSPPASGRRSGCLRPLR